MDCAVLAENKLRVLLVFSEMLLEYHTGHIRMVNLNRSDAARLKGEKRGMLVCGCAHASLDFATSEED